MYHHVSTIQITMGLFNLKWSTPFQNQVEYRALYSFSHEVLHGSETAIGIKKS